jgi:hypothetical protein
VYPAGHDQTCAPIDAAASRPPKGYAPRSYDIAALLLRLDAVKTENL